MYGDVLLANCAGSKLVKKDTDVTRRCTRFRLPSLPCEGRVTTQPLIRVLSRFLEILTKYKQGNDLSIYIVFIQLTKLTFL